MEFGGTAVPQARCIVHEFTARAAMTRRCWLCVQGNSGGGIIWAAKELLAEAANAARSTDAYARRTSQ